MNRKLSFIFLILGVASLKYCIYKDNRVLEFTESENLFHFKYFGKGRTGWKGIAFSKETELNKNSTMIISHYPSSIFEVDFESMKRSNISILSKQEIDSSFFYLIDDIFSTSFSMNSSFVMQWKHFYFLERSSSGIFASDGSYLSFQHIAPIKINFSEYSKLNGQYSFFRKSMYFKYTLWSW
jgi:hypothetical protein